MMITRLPILLSNLLIALILNACYAQTPEALTPNLTEVLNERLSSPVGPTSSPTPTVELTIALTNTNTPEIEIVSTWTPLPTLEGAHPFIATLMQDNAGCRLPCWWGITPGETSWNEARHFLESFTSIESAEYNFGEENSQSYIAFFVNPGPGESSTTAFFNIQDEIVQIIRIGKEATQYSLLLHQLLTDYGKPNAVLFGSHGGVYQYQAYSLVLVYYEQRILAEFLVEVDTAIQPLKSCIFTSPTLLVWSEELMWTQEKVLANIPSYRGDHPPSSIEITTNMDTQTFYEVYKNPAIEPCLEIK